MMKLMEDSADARVSPSTGLSPDIEIRRIVRQTERAFQLFLWCWLLICFFVLAVIFLS
jgi:hypothetical protein